MRFQDYIVDETRKRMDEAFRNAQAVPPEKLDWKPLDTGRSVLDQLQELAQCADYVTPMVEGQPPEGEWDEEKGRALIAERAAWKTIEDCERELNARLERLFTAIRQCPDERLEATQWLPYDGGRDFTIREIMEYPRWNATYHTGQICYIQTLYGDREMH